MFRQLNVELWAGMVLSIAGITLVLSGLSVSTYALPQTSRAYQSGQQDVLVIVEAIYLGLVRELFVPVFSIRRASLSWVSPSGAVGYYLSQLPSPWAFMLRWSQASSGRKLGFSGGSATVSSWEA